MAGVCPTDTCKTSPHGGYHFWRPDQVDPKSGQRGVMHWAWDLSGSADRTPVYAPEDGVVVETATGESSPWTGFQPGLVLIKGVSGVFHVLGHMDYPTIAVRAGQQVRMGQPVGVMGISHVHWEIRKARTPNWGAYPTYWQAHGPNSVNPAEWLAAVNAQASPAGIALGLLAFSAIVGAGFGLARALIWPKR